MKSEGLLCSCNQEKSLALHNYWTTTLKEWTQQQSNNKLKVQPKTMLWQRSTLADCEIWLWMMWLPWSFSFYISCMTFPERYGCYLFNATRITSFLYLELTLCTKYRLNIKSANYLQFTPFCIFHPKVPSKHKTKNIKAFYI